MHKKTRQAKHSGKHVLVMLLLQMLKSYDSAEVISI